MKNIPLQRRLWWNQCRIRFCEYSNPTFSSETIPTTHLCNIDCRLERSRESHHLSSATSNLIPWQQFDEAGSGYPSPICGRSLTISHNGKTAQATVVDKVRTIPFSFEEPSSSPCSAQDVHTVILTLVKDSLNTLNQPVLVDSPCLGTGAMPHLHLRRPPQQLPHLHQLLLPHLHLHPPRLLPPRALQHNPRPAPIHLLPRHPCPLPRLVQEVPLLCLLPAVPQLRLPALNPALVSTTQETTTLDSQAIFLSCRKRLSTSGA